MTSCGQSADASRLWKLITEPDDGVTAKLETPGPVMSVVRSVLTQAPELKLPEVLMTEP